MGREAGFTLVEVMIAFAVTAAAVAAVIEILGDGVLRTGAAADLTQATLAAQSLLESAGRDHPLEPGTTEGRTPEGLSWRLEVGEAGPPGGRGVELYRVEATVRPARGWPARPVALATLRAAVAGAAR